MVTILRYNRFKQTERGPSVGGPAEKSATIKIRHQGDPDSGVQNS